MHTTRIDAEESDSEFVLIHHSDWSGDVRIRHEGREFQLPGRVFRWVALDMVESGLIRLAEQGKLAILMEGEILR